MSLLAGMRVWPMPVNISSESMVAMSGGAGGGRRRQRGRGHIRASGDQPAAPRAARLDNRRIAAAMWTVHTTALQIGLSSRIMPPRGGQKAIP